MSNTENNNRVPLTKAAATTFARKAAAVYSDPHQNDRTNPYDFIAAASHKVRTRRPVIDPTIEEQTALHVSKNADGQYEGIEKPMHYLALSICLPSSYSEEDAEIMQLFIDNNATNVGLLKNTSEAAIEATTKAYLCSDPDVWKISVILKTHVARDTAMDRYQAFLQERDDGRFHGKAFFDDATAIKWYAKRDMQLLLENVLAMSGVDDWYIEEEKINDIRTKVDPESTLPKSLTGGTGYGMHELRMTKK